MLDSELEHAHKRCIHHRQEIEGSDVCGCFYCLATYAPNAIVEWTDWPKNTSEELKNAHGQTAVCPHCGIDAVLGSASGLAITREFLERMHRYWF